MIETGERKNMSYRSSLDLLLGQSGIVVEIVPFDRHGRGVIKVAGQLWSAETDWPYPLETGTTVMVVGRTNLILAVLPERM